MSVGGQGLPRLQELAYLETIAKAVAAGLPLEGIRLALVDHIWSLRQASPGDPPDPTDYGGGVRTRRSSSVTSPMRLRS